MRNPLPPVNNLDDLAKAINNPDIDEVVVSDGTYFLPEGRPFVVTKDRSRRPLHVKAATTGGVIFDGSKLGGGDNGLMFRNGASHQTWSGFAFRNFTLPPGGGGV